MSGVAPEGDVDDKSLGELVAMATSNVSSLIRSELELAKLELKTEAKKGAIVALMWVVGALMLCIVVILGSIAAAYLIVFLSGIYLWAGFAIVTGAYFVLGLVLLLVGTLWIRRIRPLPRTRKTAADDLKMLRRGGSERSAEAAELEDDIPTTVTPAAKPAIDK